jgi:hypothetical protein
MPYHSIYWSGKEFAEPQLDSGYIDNDLVTLQEPGYFAILHYTFFSQQHGVLSIA